MSIFEQPTTCGCNKPDCYFCWLRDKVYTTTSAISYGNAKRTKDIELCDILAEVSKASGVPIEDIVGRSRKEKIRIARQMFCYVAHKKKWSFRKIRNVINRNHATAIHSCYVVKDMFETKQQEYTSLGCKLGII